MFHPTASGLLARLAERVLAALSATAVLVYANAGRMSNGIGSFLRLRITLTNLICAFLFLWAWDLCFEDMTMAQVRERDLWSNLGRLIKACSCITLVLAVMLVATKAHTSLSTVLPLFWMVSFALICGRLAVDWAFERSRWRRHSRTVILGTGPLAREAWKELRTRHYSHLKVVGFIDEQLVDSALPEIASHYLGDVSDLESLLLREVIDSIVIAMPVRSCHASIQRAIDIGQRVGVDFLHFDNVFRFSHPLGSVPHTALRSASAYCKRFALRQAAKRAFDVLVAGTSLIVLSPLLLAIALAVRLTSQGPALFVQERYGFRRRRFQLYKFRTMVVNAEALMKDLEALNEADGPIFKMKRDPRITPLGRLLRKTSLDELPQLWNVLVGDMSLVGPRPMSMRDVALFDSSHLMRRFRVKPGITGLWQVSGRSNVSFDHWIALDFRYIDNWSLSLDAQILLKTLPAVLKGSGAM